jgi:hypothetical protein
MAQKKEKSNAPDEKNDIAKIEELGEELKKLRMELAQKTSVKPKKKTPKKEKKTVALEKKVTPKKEEKKVVAKVEKKVTPKKEEKKVVAKVEKKVTPKKEEKKVVAKVEKKVTPKKEEKKVVTKEAKKIAAKEEKKKKAEPKEEEKKTYEEELEEQLTDEEIENFQIEKMDMEKLTNRVCDIVAKYESDGMLQSELWKKLKLSSRDGSRLALKLERRGIISREKILENGRWTYKLIIKKTPVSTESIEGAPCLTCPVEQKCSLEGEISPRTCQLIEDWVLIEISKKKTQ